jgi:hypothetical protein
MPANFTNKNLRGRSFKGQDLTGADFSGADIRGVNFKGAILCRANFHDAKAGQRLQSKLRLVLASLMMAFIASLTATLAWGIGVYTAVEVAKIQAPLKILSIILSVAGFDDDRYSPGLVLEAYGRNGNSIGLGCGLCWGCGYGWSLG